MSDVRWSSRCAPEDLDKERGAVLEEVLPYPNPNGSNERVQGMAAVPPEQLHKLELAMHALQRLDRLSVSVVWLLCSGNAALGLPLAHAHCERP